MSISNIIKKRMSLFVLSLVFIIMLSITSTYAFINNDFANNSKVINKNNLQIIYENGTEKIKSSLYPMSFQQGNLESPSNVIKIVNKGYFSTKFSIVIKSVDSNSESIDMNKIYYSVNNKEASLLNTLQDNKIYSSNINGKEEYILDIKVWVASEYVDNSDQGKSINLEFDVINE